MTQIDKPFSAFQYEADKDYLLARLVNFTGNAFGSRAGYLAQQSIEKYFKAYLVQKQTSYKKTHDLIIILQEIHDIDPSLASKFSHEELKLFDDFREVDRYGSESKYDPHSNKDEPLTVTGSSVWATSHIKILDKIVFQIRKELTPQALDVMEDILSEKNRHRVSMSWNFPVTIKDVLTTGNDYYK